MSSSNAADEILPPFEEKRGLRYDRRIRDERRGARDPKYLGEVRRYTVERRLGPEDRRTSEE